MSSDAPDPDPLMGEAARMSAETAKEALSFYKDIYARDILPRQQRNDALTASVTEQQLADQKAASAFSTQQRNEYTDKYLPVERQAIQDATGYDSTQNVEKRAGIAGAGVTQAYASARQQALSTLAKYGINPSSGAFGAVNSRLATQEALAGAGARTGAAFDTMDRGIALRTGVVNTGRGLTNTSAQFLASSNQAGSSASGASGANVGAGVSSAGVMNQGFETNIKGLNVAGGLMNQQYQTQVQAAGQNPLLETIGAGVGLYAGLKG